MLLLGRYWPHIKLTLLILGLPLFVALLVGLVVEVWLYEPAFIPDVEQIDLTLISKMGSLVLTTVRLAIPVIGVFVAVPIVTSILFKKVYAIEEPNEAHKALNRVVFGQLGRRPFVIVGKGQIPPFRSRVRGARRLDVLRARMGSCGLWRQDLQGRKELPGWRQAFQGWWHAFRRENTVG